MYGDRGHSSDNGIIVDELAIRNLIDIMNSPAWDYIEKDVKKKMLIIFATYAKISVEKIYNDDRLKLKNVKDF